MSNIGEILGDFFSRTGEVLRYVFGWLSDNPTTVGDWYGGLVRWIFPVLALGILLSVLRDMLRVKNPAETWGYLVSSELGKFPIRHWECTVGRARHCDLIIDFPTISRTQCSLIRDDNGNWQVYNLSEKNPILCNGKPVIDSAPLGPGETIMLGGVILTLEPISEAEHEVQQQNRLAQSRPAPPWSSFAMLTVFQILTVGQLLITRPEHANTILLCYSVLLGVMWTYVLLSKIAKRTGFEPEILAFFACTLNLAVTASSAPGSLIKQTITILMGIGLFLGLGWFLRDLNRTVKARYLMAGATAGLLLLNLIFGSVIHGAQNWISIAGISVQPSELAKVTFIFAGCATLDRLFVKRNLWGFMLLSGFCLLALAIMSDFGTAAIFFVVFLVIAFLRSGDFATLSLICGGAVAGGGLILRFKPYIASRFSVWGHAWQNATGSGYQQVRTMSAAASGGLIGVGAGNGWLHNIAAANTDLVFGMLCEEWGLIIALLAVASIVTLSIFAFRVTKTGRSAFYTTAACAATSLLVFQTILNVFGSVDLLPLTGVTFPFISCGGSSMISSWGLLAFLKAADTRQNASFAVRSLPNLGEELESANSMETGFNPLFDMAGGMQPEAQPLSSAPDPIDSFLQQFDRLEEGTDRSAPHTQEIDDFLRQFGQPDRGEEENK
ncbi:FtsW/RodA/SpoVE family cell cycle protein [Aminipila butyrica]|uniref:FtsW/RodA/SpoVE family cell cycle protein n=2 Tax=Aminipila butyrica TaxID=433296 RepID=A0A858BZY1_9FIRM|nr:FtsW/RodA/SpoVE family cell cycle protein [Aminipila butyrica]